MMKKIVALVLLCALLMMPSAYAREGFEIHFLDVGQGDCTVVLCDGEAMVIDGGPVSASRYVYSYLRNTLRLKKIDYVVSTHPHADHIGGLASVLNAAPAELLLSPVTEWDSAAFRSMMDYAELGGTQVAVPAPGDTLRLGSADVTILNCWPDGVLSAGGGTDDARVNDASIVVRIDYGSTSFIVAGDAEDWAEYMMLDSGLPLRADVLRAAHHGSRYSSTAQFLAAVRPAWAVISVGKDNGYGHPHRETLARLAKVRATVLRTDELGTIRMASDGNHIRVL